MPILNYTTTVDAHRTVEQIRKILVSHGSQRVIVEYGDEQEPTAIEFVLATAVGPMPYSLPARIDGVLEVMTADAKKTRAVRVKPTRTQATNVAWRIIKDWIEAQLAMIQSSQLSIDEVMLPFMVTKSGDTVYELFKESRLALPGKCPT